MKALIFILSGLLLSSLAVQAHSGYVVIASNVASIKPGALIGDDESLVLAARQKVKLISASGGVLSLRGPYEGKVIPTLEKNAREDSLLASLANLVEAAQTSDLTLAVSRDIYVDDEQPRGDIWGIDISEPGNYCIQADQRPLLWWSRAIVGAWIKLENETLSQMLDVRWMNRGNQRLWPLEISINEKDAYSTTFDLSGTTVEFSLSMIPISMDNDAARLVWMSEHGCSQQSLRLLKYLIYNEE